MELTEIRYEVADGVATLTLDRPGKRNAFTGTMADELARAAATADAGDAVRVVLVPGAGRDFCVGADLSGGRDTFAGKRLTDRPAGAMGEGIGGVPRDRGGGVSLSFAARRGGVCRAVLRAAEKAGDRRGQRRRGRGRRHDDPAHGRPDRRGVRPL